MDVCICVRIRIWPLWYLPMMMLISASLNIYSVGDRIYSIYFYIYRSSWYTIYTIYFLGKKNRAWCHSFAGVNPQCLLESVSPHLSVQWLFAFCINSCSLAIHENSEMFLYSHFLSIFHSLTPVDIIKVSFYNHQSRYWLLFLFP